MLIFVLARACAIGKFADIYPRTVLFPIVLKKNSRNHKNYTQTALQIVGKFRLIRSIARVREAGLLKLSDPAIQRY